MRRTPRLLAATALLLATTMSAAAGRLAPLTGADAAPPAAWRFAGLPQQTLPATRYAVVQLDGERVLRVQAHGAYGNLVHPLAGGDAQAGTLRWRWRVDQAVKRVDLRSKAGDDTALKVCAMFDLPLDAVPFWERQGLRVARSLSAELLPAATLCYVWDDTLAAGTVLRNVYSARLRWMVLAGTGTPPGEWRSEQRDLRADFLRAFGDEAREVPPLIAIALGADTDNTGSASLGYVAGLELDP